MSHTCRIMHGSTVFHSPFFALFHAFWPEQTKCCCQDLVLYCQQRFRLKSKAVWAQQKRSISSCTCLTLTVLHWSLYLCVCEREREQEKECVICMLQNHRFSGKECNKTSLRHAASELIEYILYCCSQLESSVRNFTCLILYCVITDKNSFRINSYWNP